ncbi:MAG: hypothetical protein KDI10_12675 [Halioglobus sp.]|nr:hypothetical protein [Halioglobus sp.]MCB1709569.1 hypothetical protein [Halioglobus sp.]
MAAPPPGSPGAARPPLKSLPGTHYRVDYGGRPYFYWGGHFYLDSGGLYVSVTAPIGAIVPALPGGFITIGKGPGSYYYYGGVYYHVAPNGYVVVEQPSETPAVLPAEEASGRIIVYPAGGQSEEQTGRDRYECHLWSSRETGFDPTLSSSDASLKDDYQRAMSACLEARSYVVK